MKDEVVAKLFGSNKDDLREIIKSLEQNYDVVRTSFERFDETTNRWFVFYSINPRGKQ